MSFCPDFVCLESVRYPDSVWNFRKKLSVVCLTGRTRTPKVRTALSQSCPAGQTDNGQSFLHKSGQNFATGQDLPPSDRIFNKMYYSISNS